MPCRWSQIPVVCKDVLSCYSWEQEIQDTSKESSTRRIEVVLWNLFNISKYQSIYEVHKIKVKEDLISYIRVTWVQPAAEQKRGTYN